MVEDYGESGVRSNRGRCFPVETLTPSEVGALIRTCSTRAPTGVRNRALITVLYRAGLRISEALFLRPKDLDIQKGAIRVLRGKGGRQRTVGMDPEAFAVVEVWLARRRELGIDGRRSLFCTLKGGPLKSAYVRALLPRLAKRAGIQKRVHPHGLRHTHAAELACEGVPLNIIQAQLGHSNAATTSRYLDHIAPQEVLKTMNRREWRRGLGE